VILHSRTLFRANRDVSLGSENHDLTNMPLSGWNR